MFIALVVALVTSSNAGASAHAPSMAQLLKLHHHAMGPLPAQSARWSGSITRGSIVQPFTVTADSTGRYRASWQTALGTTLVGSDGSVDWSEDETGSVTTQASNRAFSFGYELAKLNAFDFYADASSVSGPTTFDGHQVYSIKIDDPDSPMTLYLDAKTYLIDGADTNASTIRYKSYKRFQGFPVPTEIDETSGGQTTTRKIDSVSFGVDVSGSFAAPQPREPAFPAGKTDVTIDFENPNDLILIPATIDGKSVHLLVDSGSSTSVLDADVAKRLGLPTAGVAQIEGASMLTGSYARADTFEVAGIIFTPFIFGAVPLGLPPALKRDGIDGVLGYDFLEHFVARIAYYPHELQLIEPSAFTYTGTGAVMAIDLSKHVPIVTATMVGNDKGTFTVDTGSDQGLVLYDEFASSHPRDLTHPLDIGATGSGGAGGQVDSRPVTVVQINLGEFIVNDVPAEVLLQSSGAFTPGQSDGLMGAGLFNAFRAVFLDYRGKRIILEK